MIRNPSLLLCLASVSLVIGLGTVQGAETIKPTPAIGTVQWIYSYQEGQKLARESGKPMFVVFRCER
jgi:hypothetical protein